MKIRKMTDQEIKQREIAELRKIYDEKEIIKELERELTRWLSHDAFVTAQYYKEVKESCGITYHVNHAGTISFLLELLRVGIEFAVWETMYDGCGHEEAEEFIMNRLFDYSEMVFSKWYKKDKEFHKNLNLFCGYGLLSALYQKFEEKRIERIPF